MANEGYHEPIEQLSHDTRDMHRAIVSLMEELEAVDWYRQRADDTDDPEAADGADHIPPVASGEAEAADRAEYAD